MSDSKVRVRIAPSPSGYLHVGTARTAIFNYLFARHHGGSFLVRIEDTDAARSDASLVEPILSALKWLGLESDEEIVYQSSRREIHTRAAKTILESSAAYRCFCTPEELEAGRQKAREEKKPPRYDRKCLRLSPSEIESRVAGGEAFAVRLQIPEGLTEFDDMVSGRLKRASEEIEDFIIARSDGTATYNLAVVVDDHDMRISHVIRGNDHITNTFKQIHVYRALGYDQPTFGHVPLILRPDKKKVSKRLGDKDVANYRAEGILPQAMFNYLCLLGWSPKTEQEIYTPSKLVEIFNEKHLNASNAIFNEDKLTAFNKAHIAMIPDAELAVMVAPLLIDAKVTTESWLETHGEFLRRVVELLKARVRILNDFVSLGSYFFSSNFSYDPEGVKKSFDGETRRLLALLTDELEKLPVFTAESIETCLSELAEREGVKRGKIIHPTRLAVSGMTVGPGLYDLLETLSQGTVIERLRKAIIFIESKKTT